jgi:HSP20 family molecular chaperone IbpA
MSNSVSISGERKIPAESMDAKYRRREREAGKFSGSSVFPAKSIGQGRSQSSQRSPDRGRSEAQVAAAASQRTIAKGGEPDDGQQGNQGEGKARSERATGKRPGAVFTPQVDIFETEKAITLWPISPASSRIN